MNEQQWRTERDDRTMRYAGRKLDPKRWILIRADPEYAARYDGQVAVITAANLLGRMTPSVALDIPDVQICDALPWAGRNLRQFILELLRGADPYGYFVLRAYHPGDYVLHFGSSGTGTIVHGTGWNAYTGPTPSPLVQINDQNPIGPAMAAIIASANVFVHDFSLPVQPFVLNCLTWSHEMDSQYFLSILEPPVLGDIWTIGAGSVGTAILYFLTLATSRFSTTMFDMDRVKRHNLDRSPIFGENHIGLHKVEVVKEYLSNVGVTNATIERCSLDESQLWRNRQQGVPDIIIAAANERNARPIIETGYPPLQVYGTTGRNWQASLIRHVPFNDPCSVCLFPDTIDASTACATGMVVDQNGEQHVDAALPFLSFAAGAMAAAEIIKLTLPGFPFTSNRVVLNTTPWPRVVHVPLTIYPNCICQRRSPSVHQKMIENGRYASFSRPTLKQVIN